jgi:hypothetical protein
LKPPLIALKLRTARRWRAATGMPPPRPREKSAIGARGGREQSFRIVGEDEADPSSGTLSHLSPLARALLTHGPGEAVAIAGHEAIILDVR